MVSQIYAIWVNQPNFSESLVCKNKSLFINLKNLLENKKMVLKKRWGKNIKMAAYIGTHMVYAMKLERKKLIKDDEGHKTKWERHSKKNFFRYCNYDYLWNMFTTFPFATAKTSFAEKECLKKYYQQNLIVSMNFRKPLLPRCPEL